MVSTTDGSEVLDAIVIGGSQAGLAMGYHLSRLGLRFVILDAGSEVGETWRSRWDSLVLFTSAQFSGLPGMPFPAGGDTYPTKDQVADYLQSYAAEFDLPIQLESIVTSLVRDNGGYVARAGTVEYRAQQVIVATGPFQEPLIPAVASEFGAEVFQTHNLHYRRPRLRAKPDPVIGSSKRRIRRLGVTFRPRLTGADGRTARFADGSTHDFDTIVWATGFRTDHSWVEVPEVFDAAGGVAHSRGVTESPVSIF